MTGAAAEAALRARLEAAQAEGELPPQADPARLAKFFATVLQGMSVQARDGASRDDLNRIVDLALLAWPG